MTSSRSLGAEKSFPRAFASTTNAGAYTYLALHPPTTMRITRDSRINQKSSNSGFLHSSQANIALPGVSRGFRILNSASDTPKPMTSLQTFAATLNSFSLHETRIPNTSSRPPQPPARKVFSMDSVARSTVSRVSTNTPAKPCWLWTHSRNLLPPGRSISWN